MYIETKLPDGSPALILMRQTTEERLSRTCFRGREVARAGNFSAWDGANHLFGTAHVRKTLLESVQRAVNKDDFADGTFSIEVSFAAPIGWASTTNCVRTAFGSWSPGEAADPRLVETFAPNRRSQALRIKLERTDVKAPLTSIATLVCQLKFELDRGWVIIVHSCYPGRDVGKLDGDITERERVVFFDWSHPGVDTRPRTGKPALNGNNETGRQDF